MPQLTIIGDDGLKERFSRRAKATGYINHKDKFEILARSKALVHANVMEGFNLTVPEALYMEVTNL